MSACLEAAPSVAPHSPASEARAARLAKFERERLIVDYLNRGVSVAEIAAHAGVCEKRMRAVIREILARRMPAPPEEFVATQVSRLNEALLVAYSAMSGTNLKAVDRVVKIVRELDRYHGLVAAARRFPDAPRLEAPAQNALAFGPALFCRPEFAPQALEGQDLEEIDSAPGNPMTLEAALRCAGEEDATAPALSSPGERSAREVGEPSRAPQVGSEDRPEDPPQDLEKAESAPATGVHAEGSNAAGAARERSDASASGCEAQERRAPGAVLVGRPEKLAQGTEKIELAPDSGSERDAPPALIETPFVELSRPETRWQNLHMTPNAAAAC